ncbi:unnamed protein product [Clonostachys solani]|uniref:Serine-rich protein n=1 Tax=Clonostachys solani TaxID=160281 RepID=A0A9N9ZPS1_9HYPO|nr:unnamed protein product [Clonostachys solani]
MSSPSAATSEVVPTSNVVPTSAATSNAAPSTSAAVPSSASQPATSQQPTSAAPTTSAVQPTTSASSQAPSSSAQPTTSQAPTSSAQPTTSNPPTSAPSSSAAASSSAPASSQAPVTSSAAPSTFVTTIIPTDGGSTQTSVVVVTSTINGVDSTASSTSSSTSSPSLTPGDSSGSGSSGLKTDAKVAIGVVVPIAGIALIAIAALFFWRKRKARLAAEEERRKEVEDYSYNPNADPTIPGVVDGGYEMNEDTSGGYRGWGTTTLASSNGRKASTTLSGGKNAYSDPASPTQAPIGVARSDGEILGAMNNNGNSRAVGVDRGPSNASSSYSAANRSDGSDIQGGVSYGQGATYYDVQDQEPYTDGHYHDTPAQPVIRDNPARRNTRIENTSHYPQQSAGISQNF